MTPRRQRATFARCLFEPLTDLRLLTTLILFWIFFALAIAGFRLFSLGSATLGILTVGLLLWMVVPTIAHYLLGLLEARALEVPTPLLTIGMFNVANRVWRLSAFVYAALFVLLHVTLARHAPVLAPAVPLVAGALLLPLMLIELAVTHDPVQGLNPVALYRLAVRLGPAYLPVPAALLAGMLALLALHAAGASVFLQLGGWLYWLALLSVLSGTVAAAGVDVRAEIDIPPPLPLTDADLSRHTLRRRAAALNLAYGLVSRGNRNGGFKHLGEASAVEADPLAAERWYFDAMLKWESNDAALFYAQSLLVHLLDAGEESAAMKLIVRCLHANPGFLPLPGDRERLLEVATRLGHRDVMQALAR